MGEFIKIGGKYVDRLGAETAKGIAVDANGCVEIVRHNESEVAVVIDNLAKRDTETIGITGANAVDLTEWTTCCIQITNTLDVTDAYLQFNVQHDPTRTTYLRDANGDNLRVKLLNGMTYIITPDDLPVLNYLRYFNGAFYFPTAPTSGNITVSLLLKR